MSFSPLLAGKYLLTSLGIGSGIAGAFFGKGDSKSNQEQVVQKELSPSELQAGEVFRSGTTEQTFVESSEDTDNSGAHKDDKLIVENSPQTVNRPESQTQQNVDLPTESNLEQKEQESKIAPELQPNQNIPVKVDSVKAPETSFSAIGKEQLQDVPLPRRKANPSNKSWFNISSSNYNDLVLNELDPNDCQKKVDEQQVTFVCSWDISSSKEKTNISFSFAVYDYPNLQQKNWEDLNEISIYPEEDNITIGLIFNDDLGSEIKVPIVAPKEYLEQVN
ncbi:hypothetical protein OVS_04215 [Mycoplasma ovis str. Michigan]|uniref:Uncharacterized protein n=1 Tax=Mycoplasma ovis str. Michigan TaxID=1415773 RepID=A0ABM5P2F3_9MOLU|nr:hypothetical protein [Mycoplasma ovis]AHC40570.1 hypothetical protein OVS_04215 [Mycoplasma ovis str. Michigan]